METFLRCMRALLMRRPRRPGRLSAGRVASLRIPSNHVVTGVQRSGANPVTPCTQASEIFLQRVAVGGAGRPPSAGASLSIARSAWAAPRSPAAS